MKKKTVQSNQIQQKMTAKVAQKILRHTSQILVLYPMVGFYAFLQPMQAYAQYIPDINQITKVEPIVETDLPFYVFQGRTPNITMPLSVEFPITSAAWRLPEKKFNIDVKIRGQDYTLVDVYSTNGFSPERNYTGYFNPTGCYDYDKRQEVFIYEKQSNLAGGCDAGLFSGGALNWAGMTTLDLVRYALTGGNRVVDTPNQTIIQRSRVFSLANDELADSDSDGDIVLNVARHTNRFPMKEFDRYGLDGNPTTQKRYARSCGENFYVSKNDDMTTLLTHDDCEQLEGGLGRLDIYKMRVQVCDAKDAQARPQYCQRYPSGFYKPVGVLQEKSSAARVGSLSYLNYGRNIIERLMLDGKKPRLRANTPATAYDNETNGNRLRGYWVDERSNHLAGGVLRAPNKFLGNAYYNDRLNFADNPLREFDPDTGVIIDRGEGQRLVTATGIEAPSIGGPSVIGYTNKFGNANYVKIDDLTELTSETIRYIGNVNSPSDPVAVDGDPEKTRQPLYFKRVWTTGSDGSGIDLSAQQLNTTQLNDVMPMHYDYFPVIEEWNWKKSETDNKADEPIRTKCEAENTPRMIMLSDVNNFHAFTGVDPATNFMTSTRVQEDGILRGDLKNILNTYVNHNNTISDQILSDVQPPRSGNRYLVSAITASANLDSINYKATAMNKVTPTVRVKSSMIDVGEPLSLNSIDGSVTKIRSLGQPEDCHLFYAGALGTADSINEFVTQFSSNACQNFLNARDTQTLDLDNTMPPGYFYPSNPQKMITNIRQSFSVPFDISGNLQVGAFGSVSDSGDEVSLFQFNLDVLKNKQTQTTHLRSLPKKYTISNINNNGEPQESREWAENLYLSMRDDTNRTIFIGQEKLDESIADNAAAKNFSILTNAATEFSGSIPEARAQMTKRLINFLRGDDSAEGTTDPNNPRPKIFRTRSIGTQTSGNMVSSQNGETLNSLISSTQNSNPIVLPKTSENGIELVYISSNDGMLHAIDAKTGKIKFSYIPQILAPKIAQTAVEGYQNMNLFESFLVGGTTYDENTKMQVVAGGFGLGEKGVFALDVTNIHKNNANLSSNNILFEFNDKDDADVGHVVGQPEIVFFNTKQNDGSVKRQSYLLFTSGYKYQGTTNKISHLFLLKINSDNAKRGLGLNKTWVLNQDYFKIPIQDATFGAKANNGFTPPQSFVYNQQIISTYFGDLYGNLWKVKDLDKVVSGTGTATVLRLYEGLNNVSSANGEQLQAITAKPNLVLSNLGGIMVTFGTGRLLGINDLGTKNHTTQALIGIRDDDNIKNVKANDLAKHVMNNDLTDDNLIITEAAQDQKKGWYLSFPDKNQGMRMTTTPRIINGTLLFSTQATGAFSINECGKNSGGFGVVNVETGRADGLNKPFRRYQKIIGEVLIQPQLKQAANTLGVTGTGTGVSIQPSTQAAKVFLGGADSVAGIKQQDTVGVNTRARAGVLSWREIEDSN